MLKPMVFANAFTVVTLGLYVVCRMATLVAPDFMFGIARSWFHTFSLDSLRSNVPMDWGTFIFGGVTLAVLTWVTTYAGAYLYNRFAKSG